MPTQQTLPGSGTTFVHEGATYVFDEVALRRWRANKNTSGNHLNASLLKVQITNDGLWVTYEHDLSAGGRIERERSISRWRAARYCR